MALAKHLEQARRQTATAENRLRQHRAELRLEEIVKVAGIADDYDHADRIGDLNVETAFARIYQMAESEPMREAIVQAFVAWQNDERAEESIVHGGVDSSVSMLKRHNPAFIEGAFVPEDSDYVA